LGTFVHVLITVEAAKAIDAATERLPRVGFYLAGRAINTTECRGQSFGTRKKLRWLLLIERPGFVIISLLTTEESWSLGCNNRNYD
jgi:hypothetical protein